ncbi:SLC45 family MFS transporter [Paenarthrobacter nitroguajacolicus]|uniref:SLC45 family MFS transporter n=1 Tax=Paenarthrobacter nitroguajacolicus TaxID=211146 RepID=A0A558GNQ1_PAENT|nr:MFS transporter [Paenarthrobacter nitroguajacolicus]TVU58478.1 SLC45 family MFS transporter [Paenarthrobacter nitroguajacolicus]
MSISGSGFGEISRPADTAFVAAVVDGERVTEPMTPTMHEPPQRTSRRGIAAILILTFGNGFATLMPPLVALPVIIGRIDPEGKANSLGLALGLSALALLIFAPIFGAVSDRTTSRLGMRRPGIIGGTLVIVGGLFTQGVAQSLPVLIGGVVLMAFGAAILTGSYAALIPDQVAPASRGRVLGFQSLMLVLAGVSAAFVGAELLDNQVALFGGGAVLMIVTSAIAVVLLRDRILDKNEVSQLPVLRTLVEGFRYNPKSAPNYSWVWASRFIITLSTTFGGFSLYFMTDQLGVTEEQLPGLITLSTLVNLAGTVVGTLVGGFISGKLGRLPNLVIIVSVIFAIGGVLAAFSTTVPMFMLALGIIALAIGSFLPVDGALVMAVLPGGKGETGKYMSIITIADQLPRSIGPLLVPAIIALGAVVPLGGYSVLYIVMGIVAVAGGLIVRRVKNLG